MSFDDMERKIGELNQRISDRKDFLVATRRADHLPDDDLDKRFMALVKEIKRRNDLDAERLESLYAERDLLEMEESA